MCAAASLHGGRGRAFLSEPRSSAPSASGDEAASLIRVAVGRLNSLRGEQKDEVRWADLQRWIGSAIVATPTFT
jgi:hypothetical protein